MAGYSSGDINILRRVDVRSRYTEEESRVDEEREGRRKYPALLQEGSVPSPPTQASGPVNPSAREQLEPSLHTHQSGQHPRGRVISLRGLY